MMQGPKPKQCSGDVRLSEQYSVARRALELCEEGMVAARTMMADTDMTPEREAEYLAQVAALEAKLGELEAAEAGLMG